jgi:hypothetical protein
MPGDKTMHVIIAILWHSTFDSANTANAQD